MVVYLTGEGCAARSLHSLLVCPGAELPGAECPADWIDADGKRKTFTVDFRFGRAEVPSNIGQYLVAKGYASKTRLIIPKVA
jgi:hypothetical protein